MALIVLNVAMIRNISYTVAIPNTRADGTQYLTKVVGLSEAAYDSLLTTIPVEHNQRSLVESSRQTFYFNRLPGKVLNIIHCIYIYYVVVVSIRTIMYIRKRTRGNT